MDIKNKTILTGIKPSGQPHVGNYLGAIQPMVNLSDQASKSYFFIADYHALNTLSPNQSLGDLVHLLAAQMIASGFDYKKHYLYRQSDIPEIFELQTIFNSFTPKGWMNKSHAYKAAVDLNRLNNKDVDNEVNMGLYNYPILMAADILIFNTDLVPVGKDQVQHVEIARDIATRFNSRYKSDVIKLPNYYLKEEVKEVPGLDGRKMSKSYNNVIPLFATTEDWHNAVKKIVTDSKDNHTEESIKDTVFYKIYSSISSNEQNKKIVDQLVNKTIGWREAKDELLNIIIDRFQKMSEDYFNIIKDPALIDKILKDNALLIQPQAQDHLDKVKKVVGI